MARKGRDFELAYKWLYDLDEKYKVTSPAYLYDRAAEEKREVDVLIEYTDENSLPRKLAIECRDRKNIQDVIWIEQLIQKKEDLGLDYIVATTTTSFTKSAIKKAKYYGVIIERAEMFNSKTIIDNVKNSFLDAFFFKLKLQSLNIVTQNNKTLTYKDFINTLNVIEQSSFVNYLNSELYYFIDTNTILDYHQIKQEDFFSCEDNSIELNGYFQASDANIPCPINTIKTFIWKAKGIPYKISLPLLDSISIFDGESHANKDYRAIFGNDQDYFRFGYLKDKLFVEMDFKQREYLRFTGMNLNINTIIPEEVDKSAMDATDYIIKHLLGKFDMSELK